MRASESPHQRGKRAEGACMALNALACGVHNIDAETLKLLAAIRPGNFQREPVAATEIRSRTIGGNKSRCLGGKALLEICGLERGAFNADGAMGGRGREADRRQRPRRTILTNIGVNADAKIPSWWRLQFAIEAISLRQGRKRRQAQNGGESKPEPARSDWPEVLLIHVCHPR
jgi:hypothetical protein